MQWVCNAVCNMHYGMCSTCSECAMRCATHTMECAAHAVSVQCGMQHTLWNVQYMQWVCKGVCNGAWNRHMQWACNVGFACVVWDKAGVTEKVWKKIFVNVESCCYWFARGKDDGRPKAAGQHTCGNAYHGGWPNGDGRMFGSIARWWHNDHVHLLLDIVLDVFVMPPTF